MDGDKPNGNGHAHDTFKPGDICKLIPQIMAEMKPIAKDRKNPQQNYQFRGIDDVLNTIQPLLAKHQVFIIPFVVSATQQDRQTQKGGTLIYTKAIIDHRFVAPDGSYVTARTIGEAMDSGDKSANKAMSAAMKYACIEVFAIPTEGDNDTENNSHEVAPQTTAPNFLEALYRAFDEAGWPDDPATNRENFCKAVLHKKKAKRLEDLSQKDRMGMIESIATGKANPIDWIDSAGTKKTAAKK